MSSKLETRVATLERELASLKETVNQALRKGLIGANGSTRPRFQVKPITGTRLNEIWKSESASELLEQLDGPEHR